MSTTNCGGQDVSRDREGKAHEGETEDRGRIRKGISLKEDLYEMIERLLRFPYREICVHSVAIDILSVLERHGEIVDDSLVRAIFKNSAGDKEALAILAQRKKGKDGTLS